MIPWKPEDRKLFLSFLCIWFISFTVPPDLASQGTWEKVLAPIMDEGSCSTPPIAAKNRGIPELFDMVSG